MKKRFYYIIMCFLLTLSTKAQTIFRTAELDRLASALSLDASALPEGYSHPIARQLRLTVHTSGNTIDHIGMYLFSDELRTGHPSPVFNFLERYFLQLKYPQQVKTTANMMRDDQFVFTKGSIAIIEDILPTDDFTFNRDNHRYLATWSRNGLPFLSVTFPVEYELMSGENKIEAEDNLQADIMGTVQDSELNVGTGVKGDLQSPVPARSTKAPAESTYISKYFSNRLYTANGQLIASEKHPVETAANMMLSQKAALGYDLAITQVSYGFKKTTFSVPLQQWISFCQSHGCHLYFGVEEVSDQGDVNATVLAVNEEENYNHVMTVNIPSRCIAGEKGGINARLYPYVPTHNVLNMFAPYRKSNPKTFVSK